MEQKNFLFVTMHSMVQDMAWRVKKEGHNVKYYTKDIEQKEVGMGFFPLVEDWEKEIDWADIIIFDDVGLGEKVKALRKKGKLVIGGTPYTDKLEENKTFGQEELKNAGISIIPYADFNSFDEAIKFVEENPDRYVLKPSGKVQYDKGLSFIGEEKMGKDMIQVLNDYNKAWSKKIVNFQLQKRIFGVEVAVGAFFNGNEFIFPICVNFEHKRLFPGDLGPLTGEMGTSMFWSSLNKLFENTLKKMQTKLAEEEYVGYIDINCIVNNHGIYPLEWTTRFGYPIIAMQTEGILNPLGEFLYGLAEGKNFKLKTKSGFHICVMIVVPPFPFKDKETFNVKSKDSIVFFKNDNREGICIGDLKLVEGEWLVSGEQGGVVIVCGIGPTMRQAQQQVYCRIKNINVPNMYYRVDIGERWNEDSDKLHAWGYLREA